MRKQLPASRTQTGRDTVYQIVRTQDGRTFRVPEHKAKRFAERIEHRSRDVGRAQARTLTRNQWDSDPAAIDYDAISQGRHPAGTRTRR